MGSAAPVLRASASNAMPPAPASQGCSGAEEPKPNCVPHTAPAATSPSMAGTPRRKKAEKLTTTSTSIRARVATIPASPAAAIVVPLVAAGVAEPVGAYPVYPTRTGSPWVIPADPVTSLHECNPAFEVTAAATPAGTIASSRPATIATALRRRTATGSQTRLTLRPMPVSIKRSRSKVVPQRTVRAKQAVRGSSNDPIASGERKTNRARGRSATAAETGERKKRHAGAHPQRHPHGADDSAREHLEPDERGVVDRRVEQHLQRLLRLLPPDPD